MNSHTCNSEGTVMIVDDVPANLALLFDTLEEAGYRVLVATDGSQALEQLQRVTPDLLLLDILMPGMDGLETCRQLKADPALKSIPVIFMTALSELNYLLSGFREGALDYIVKPIRNQEVLARVAAHISQARKIKRSEQVLVQSGLTAVAINANGEITWFSPSAEILLKALEKKDFEANSPPFLPAPLGQWAKTQIDSDCSAQPRKLVYKFRNIQVMAQIAPYQSEGEYFILLSTKSSEWNLNFIHDNFGLSLREAEVLMWVARSKTNREIGQILGISHRTVNKHLEHIFEKLGVATRASAVAVIMDQIQHNHCYLDQN